MKNKLKPNSAQVEEEIKTLDLVTLKAMYRKQLLNLLVGIFEWEFPNDDCYIPSFIVETQLMELGKCIFYFDEEYGLIAPKWVVTTTLDFYGLPTNYDLFSFNNKWNKYNVPESECVLGQNNKLLTGYFDLLERYSTYMAEADLVRRQNLKLSRGFLTALCSDERQELAVQQKMTDLLGFKDFTLINPQLNGTTDFSNNDIPFKGNEYCTYMKSLMGEFCEQTGIQALLIEKNERLNMKESNRSESTLLKLIDMYDARQNIVKEIKDKYGIEVKCELNVNRARQILVEFTEKLNQEKEV